MIADSTPEQERAAADYIRKEMRKYLTDWYGVKRAAPKKRIASSETHTIGHGTIIGGVALFVMNLGLYGGSCGDMDLYKLLIAYLHDDLCRAQMNDVVSAWEARKRAKWLDDQSSL